ncbi:MAG: glycosyltransferase [Planctomycetes bacterium]|nr:glycosyltransferase [Planctomycetota bacterium]
MPALAVWWWHDQRGFLVGASVTLMSLYAAIVGTKVIAVLCGLVRRHALVVDSAELRALADDSLPLYTIQVPMYREAAVLPDLVAALERLDYPRDRIDAQLLLEEDDLETIACARALTLPDWIRIVVVPPGTPKTKPRACNHGLISARGEFLVIFDAEDRPEPDQLKKAVAAFRRVPATIACLQAKLNCYNRSKNLITRWFTLEYTAWFDLYLPGLHAIGAPIPLGGTSNHFRTAVLRALGGWDPYNVTEDCDLGMRLERAGWRTRILDSTTWEEAPSRWITWLKQRSRWMKGYWQTHLVHTREPIACLRELGPWKMALMLFTVGGQVGSLLINPLCWVIGAAWLVHQWPLFDPNQPWTVALVVATVALLLSNLVFILIHLLGALGRGFHNLVPFALLLPFYWVLLSIATWRGFLQFFTAPFKWEKTPHGVVRAAAAASIATGSVPAAVELKGARTAEAVIVIPASTPLTFVRRAANALAIAVVVAAIAGIAWRTPVWMDVATQIKFAAIRMDAAVIDKERKLDVSWLAHDRVEYEVELAPLPAASATASLVVSPVEPPARPVVRAVAFLKVWDGEWYQLESRTYTESAKGLTISFPLDGPWTSTDCTRPWNRDCLRRVRAAGLRLYGVDAAERGMKVVDVRALGAAPTPALEARITSAPSTAERFRMSEIAFALSRTYANPFDPDEVDVWGEFTDPSGRVARVPAFYTQDYDRSQDVGAQPVREVLKAVGEPHWAVRYTPMVAGRHTWVISGKDRAGGSFSTPPATVTAADSQRHGFVRVDADNRHFSYDDGTFFYPVTYNIRSPRDTIDERLGKIPQPNEALGSYVMEDFITRMGTASVTVGRIWMSPWFGSLEWRRDVTGFHGLGVYNLQNAWRLDHLLRVAADRGVLLEFALNHHGPFTEAYDSQWRDNPFNVRNKGPLARPQEVMTNPEALRLFKNRYRYIAARWGADPTVFAWTMWIEVDTVSDNNSATTAMHLTLARQMKEQCQGKQVISTEFCNTPGIEELWRAPEIQYTQMGAYSFGTGLVRTFQERARELQYGKPLILEEYGGHAQGGSQKWIAHEIHDGPWAGWMLPLGGTPMPWWWNLIFANNLERHTKRFADYIAGEDLRGVVWNLQQREVIGPEKLMSLIRAGSDRAYLWIYSRPVTDFSVRDQYWQQAGTAMRTYEGRVKGFDALAKDPGALFPAVAGLSVAIGDLGLTPGRYAVEYWDTWSTTPPERREIVIPAGAFALPLPELTRDCAVKLKRLGE